jgi:hypothetical protein
MKKLTRDRVAPIISARVSWLIFAISGSGRLSLPKFARLTALGLPQLYIGLPRLRSL